ncbi:hypothetical protein O0L34_g5176 [Tuta absoluta]|nr:hypothetical protein O0L34_g18146 [Tuta absoluta]KAJ2946240.1 hypothetical protein O0L34_g5176 [Tuta absoluta]
MEEVKMSLENLSKLFTAQMARYESRTQVSDIPADYAEFKSFVVTALDSLYQQIDLLASEVDQLEMRSRRKMLLIHGVQESAHQDSVSEVMDLCKTSLGLAHITPADISRTHRLGRVINSKPRPLLVKFTSMEIRSKVWAAKTGLKGSGVTISEFLTKRRHEVFMAAREQFGISKSWTRDGTIVVLTKDGSKCHITTMKELEKISGPKKSCQRGPQPQSSGQPKTPVVADPNVVAQPAVAPKKPRTTRSANKQS